MSFLENLKTLIDVTVSKINMPIALFGKTGDTYNIDKVEHYHNPIIVQVKDIESAEKIIGTLQRHDRPVVETQDNSPLTTNH